MADVLLKQEKGVEVYIYGRLLHSGWLITSAFYGNDKHGHLLELEEQQRIRDLKRRGLKSLNSEGIKLRNMRGFLQLWSFQLKFWYSVLHCGTFSSSTQLTWCRLRDSKCSVSSRLGVYLD